MVYLFPRMQWVLTPFIRRTLPLKKQMERRQNWLSANLLSSSYLSGDLVKSYCQYQKSNWNSFSFVSRDRFIFQKGSYFWEKKLYWWVFFFLLIIPFNRDWVQYLFIAYLSLQISARHPQCSDRFWINRAVDYHAIYKSPIMTLACENIARRNECFRRLYSLMTPIQMPNW